MSYEIKANYNQILLLPPSVDDWVPKNHPVRFIRDFVDAINLDEIGINCRETSAGRPNYSAELLLKVWLYGYYSGIRSVRKLEKACWENVAFIWLTGMNYPDHNTLWRFFKNYGDKVDAVFKKSVHIALKSNLIGMVVNAIDGTKIGARASKDTAYYRSKLDELLKRTDEFIESYRKEVETAHGDETEDNGMPDELVDAKERAERIRSAIKTLDAADVGCMNPKEPEARMMKGRDGYKMGYNGQAVADEKEGILVAQGLVNEENDQQELVPMLDKAKEVVGKAADENLADAGYYTSKQIGIAEERGYNVLLAPREMNGVADEKGEFSKYHFSYDKEKDEVICPTGKVLRYERTEKANKTQRERRIYRCKQFKECPYRDKCSKDKFGRAVKLEKYHEAVVRQREKQKDEMNKKLMKLRKKIVEPVFAQIKWIMEFRRFTVFGLAKAGMQWALVCAAYNLRKLYKHWLKGALVFEQC